MKSKEWLDRNKKDFYVKQAKNSGYVSRSAFKLKEIDNKFNLISGGKNIIEFGSAPGGWSQVILEINKRAKIYAFDLLDMKFNHTNLNFIKEDFMKFNYGKLNIKFDLIISDIAPNTTGHKSTDHLRISSMIDGILNLLDEIALPSSSLIFKIWKGSEEKNIIKFLKKKYTKVSYFKPNSSRSESSEIFIVALKFIN
tara:strand:- start:1131 stop:1721 length:591 start_codon:yes stop_codon:yes gene_type:complete